MTVQFFYIFVLFLQFLLSSGFPSGNLTEVPEDTSISPGNNGTDAFFYDDTTTEVDSTEESTYDPLKKTPSIQEYLETGVNERSSGMKDDYKCWELEDYVIRCQLNGFDPDDAVVKDPQIRKLYESYFQDSDPPATRKPLRNSYKFIEAGTIATSGVTVGTQNPKVNADSTSTTTMSTTTKSFRLRSYLKEYPDDEFPFEGKNTEDIRQPTDGSWFTFIRDEKKISKKFVGNSERKYTKKCCCDQYEAEVLTKDLYRRNKGWEIPGVVSRNDVEKEFGLFDEHHSPQYMKAVFCKPAPCVKNAVQEVKCVQKYKTVVVLTAKLEKWRLIFDTVTIEDGCKCDVVETMDIVETSTERSLENCIGDRNITPVIYSGLEVINSISLSLLKLIKFPSDGTNINSSLIEDWRNTSTWLNTLVNNTAQSGDSPGSQIIEPTFEGENLLDNTTEGLVTTDVTDIDRGQPDSPSSTNDNEDGQSKLDVSDSKKDTITENPDYKINGNSHSTDDSISTQPDYLSNPNVQTKTVYNSITKETSVIYVLPVEATTPKIIPPVQKTKIVTKVVNGVKSVIVIFSDLTSSGDSWDSLPDSSEKSQTETTLKPSFGLEDYKTPPTETETQNLPGDSNKPSNVITQIIDGKVYVYVLNDTNDYLTEEPPRSSDSVSPYDSISKNPLITENKPTTQTENFATTTEKRQDSSSGLSDDDKKTGIDGKPEKLLCSSNLTELFEGTPITDEKLVTLLCGMEQEIEDLIIDSNKKSYKTCLESKFMDTILKRVSANTSDEDRKHFLELASKLFEIHYAQLAKKSPPGSGFNIVLPNLTTEKKQYASPSDLWRQFAVKYMLEDVSSAAKSFCLERINNKSEEVVVNYFKSLPDYSDLLVAVAEISYCVNSLTNCEAISGEKLTRRLAAAQIIGRHAEEQTADISTIVESKIELIQEAKEALEWSLDVSSFTIEQLQNNLIGHLISYRNMLTPLSRVYMETCEKNKKEFGSSEIVGSIGSESQFLTNLPTPNLPGSTNTNKFTGTDSKINANPTLGMQEIVSLAATREGQPIRLNHDYLKKIISGGNF